MRTSSFGFAAIPLACLALAACASETTVAPASEGAAISLSVGNNVGLNSVTNVAAFGTGDVAQIGAVPGRPNAIRVSHASGSQWCRSNGPGDDPGAGSIRAIYADGNGNPAALAYKGTSLKVYSRIPNVGNFVCQNLNAVVGGDDLNLGTAALPASVGGGTPSVFVVQNEVNGRVEFRRERATGTIIGRTNGAGDNGTLIAGWIGSDGKPYALIGRGDSNIGEYRVITPTFVSVGIFPVHTVGRVTH